VAGDAPCQNRLMKTTQKIVPELYCTDYELSLAFYVGVVGFIVVYERPDERFAYLDLDGAELMIEQTTELDRTLVSGDLIHPYGRGMNLQITVDSVDLIHARVDGADATIFLPMEERWYQGDDIEMGQRQFVAADPDGYLLRFCQALGERPLTVSTK
jgi:catechol 2,3-dioxygenase-like lactoylglutathione lyase family enzyme